MSETKMISKPKNIAKKLKKINDRVSENKKDIKSRALKTKHEEYNVNLKKKGSRKGKRRRS